MSGTQKLLKSYLENYKVTNSISRGDNPLIVNQRMKKLSRWGVSHIIDKYVEMAKTSGLDADFPITPHYFAAPKPYIWFMRG